MDCQKLMLTTFILMFFWFTGSIKNTVSQPSSADCPLDLRYFTRPQNFTCEEGTWNDFLHDKCCKGPFNMYLDALALRANQTLQIYLNSTEQTSCLMQMKDNITDVFSCGIDKLTNGINGCSDFSVQDVLTELHAEFEGLLAGCGLLGHEGDGDGWRRACGNCVQSWKEIKGITSRDGDADLCRFAVLTSLTGSRIDDFVWMQNIHKCLGEQVMDKDSDLIGLLSGISAMVVVCVYIIARRRYRSHVIANEDGMKRDLPKKSQYLEVPVKEIHYATNNLDQLNYIGEGTAGKVYRGILSNKQHVAVKHIINDGFVETFLREVRNLALVRHPNLVALLGYCDNGDECFLIYELCTNGNLSEWLFGKNKVLSWIQRLEIAIDCARGLWFLHTYSEGCIVHRDIKPTNILLGPNFEAKLSDFGLSKVIDIGETHVSSEVRGTFGYVDPEYQSDRQVNSAGDVYSFGIVLLQILSGRKVINMNASNPMPLGRTAKSLTKGGSIVGFADPKLESEYSADAFELTFKLALSCTGHKQERPSMEKTVEQLEKSHEISVSQMTSYLHKT
ncbi:leucine-rich repeat receptor-like serine/threonine-protein kinase At2g14510 [Cynara cardunculus var. scolymus]|uniref:leucine-rich repeat receptor-like serine/threonine-protein kinase At2g14510 n=1 Tax=Cynara cardunculus var. scolymus TaxID=59895 RepID=UPI000D62E19D|nr:leucine-rich repeat receptor-like serine/threonine-protein kinase At2g14510 [Cynara cardunculus var. scolymus]